MIQSINKPIIENVNTFANSSRVTRLPGIPRIFFIPVFSGMKEPYFQNTGMRSAHQGSYSLKHIVRTIEQRSYDLCRRYDTTYSHNVSQTVIVSYVRYDVGASSLTNVLHFDRKNATRCTKTRHFDIKKSLL